MLDISSRFRRASARLVSGSVERERSVARYSGWARCWTRADFIRQAPTNDSGTQDAIHPAGNHMLKLIGSYAIAKLLGFGIVGAIVIYILLSLVS
jgi:hypothetical protein